MRLAIGIDTGGTCTDAVLYDTDTGRVLGRNKALTTHDDLKRGILEALDGLDIGLCRQAAVAGLSTTLATNACVEGKLRRVRLLLMGIDRTGIEKHGARYGFTDPDDIRYLPCRTTIAGQVEEEPDWGLLEERAGEWFAGVEGCAVCEIFGMRNGGVLERKAARIIEERTGLPAVCASALFGGLSSLERAASAVLNAGLLAVTREFLDAVAAAFRQRGIAAELMIVRSDSGLMGRDYSAEHAVETLLSGPAASALGGSALAGAARAVVVDMGGTTTDVALVEGGAPLLADDGIRVGRWKTLVRGVFSTSFALGGDSAIRWDQYGRVTVGPDRILPLCVLASRRPEIVPVLARQVRATPAHTLPLHEFLTLARPDWRAVVRDERETVLCAALEGGPLNVCQAAALLGVDKYQLSTRALEQAGVLLRAGLTPTDLMHVRGDFTRYDGEAARLAAEFAAASLGKSVAQLGDDIYERIAREIFYAVSESLLEHSAPRFRAHGLDDGLRELLRLQWENRERGGAMLDYGFRARAALVGIGGPIHLFLPAVARALGAECIVPDCAAVANAVGAVTGRMTVRLTAEIRPHGRDPLHPDEGDYEVLADGEQPCYFADEGEAAAWAAAALREAAARRLRAQGAAGEIQTEEKTEDVCAGALHLSTRITVTATTGGRIR